MSVTEFRSPFCVTAGPIQRGKLRRMRVEAIILCEDVRKRPNGTYDILGAGVEIICSSSPRGLCYVYVMLRVAYAEHCKSHVVRAALIGDDGAEVDDRTYEGTFQRIPGYREGADMPFALIFDFHDAGNMIEGRYALTISWNGTQIGMTEFEVAVK